MVLYLEEKGSMGSSMDPLGMDRRLKGEPHCSELGGD